VWSWILLRTRIFARITPPSSTGSLRPTLSAYPRSCSASSTPRFGWDDVPLINRAKLEQFLQEDFVTVVAVTSDVARRYGELFVELRRAGTPIPVNDIWIAAATMVANAHLLTFDTDFDRIDRLDRTVFR
jgi:hypothetical protein